LKHFPDPIPTNLTGLRRKASRSMRLYDMTLLEGYLSGLNNITKWALTIRGVLYVWIQTW